MAHNILHAGNTGAASTSAFGSYLNPNQTRAPLLNTAAAPAQPSLFSQQFKASIAPSYAPFKSQEGKELFTSGVASGATNTSPGLLDQLLENKDLAGNVAGLAGTALQAIALPSALKSAKLQRKALEFNLDTARKEQGRRDRNISGFNRPTSAFAG